MIVLWSFGILYGSLWSVGVLYGMIHLHRVTLRALFVVVTHAYIAYISFRYLRKEQGGPIVQFESEELLSVDSSNKLRSLWK